MTAQVLDLVAAWKKRGRVIPIPSPPEDPAQPRSTLAARCHVVKDRVVISVENDAGEALGQIALDEAKAKSWGAFISAFERERATARWRAKRTAERVAEGLCGATFNCKRRLVAGTNYCRKCGEQIAARARENR